MVELSGVSLFYPAGNKGLAALQQISARFETGNFSAIIGPSGCGKTSLIKIMAALIKPSEGSVTIDGKPLDKIRADTAVIFQDYGLLPWKTVRANAELPLRIKNGLALGTNAVGRQKAEALLAEFGLAAFANAYPHQLSGGMKQRLAIVRSLAASPQLLLMDEPFSSLDSLTREDAQEFLLSVQTAQPKTEPTVVPTESRLTVIMVTHSIEEAVYLADSVYVMNGVNPGSITERITIERDANVPRTAFREQESFQEYCAILRRALRQSAGRTARRPAERSAEQPEADTV